MSRKLTSTLAIAALLAIAGGARAQDNAPTCNPNTGRATERIACLNKISRALSDKIRLSADGALTKLKAR